MGKAPLELGTRGDTMVTTVACHPTDDIVAIGYADGMVMAARFADQKEVLLAPLRQGRGHGTGLGQRGTAAGRRHRDGRLRDRRHFGLSQRPEEARPTQKESPAAHSLQGSFTTPDGVER